MYKVYVSIYINDVYYSTVCKRKMINNEYQTVSVLSQDSSWNIVGTQIRVCWVNNKLRTG